MSDILRNEQLTPVQLKALLAHTGDDLSEEQIAALHDFLERVGSLENAQLAVKMLRSMAA
jgi:hypothetical protein